MIKMIPKFDGENFIEGTRPLSDIPQIAWPFVSNIIYGIKEPELILIGSREGEGNTSDLDDNDSNPRDVSVIIRAV